MTQAHISRSLFRASRTAPRIFGLCVLAAACHLSLQATAFAAPQAVNTFKGQCVGVPVMGYWPVPLKFTPQIGDFIAIPDGGSCTGTVNGKPFEGPLQGRVEFHGLQSCGQALIQGRSHTTIGGKDFYASVAERRVGREAVILAQGDSGGQMLIKAYGRVGLVKDSDPLAQEPVVRPFAEPIDIQEFEAACSGPGLTQIPILIEFSSTGPTGVSSPAQENGSSQQASPPAPPALDAADGLQAQLTP